jgi:molecular chaperone GrpE (heat shock protein)
VDTADTVVRKSTGTHRSHIVDDEIEKIFRIVGVTEIDAEVGAQYVAHFHQPIKRERGTYAKNSITEIHARGFMDDNGHVLRKTRVTISE